MEDRLRAFIDQTSGQVVQFDSDPADAGQCVQLAARWCQVNGLPVLWHNATDWFNFYGGDFEQHWVKVVNNPNDYAQLPSPGDLVVWNSNLPGSGGFGHIDIFVRSNGVGSFEGFDSNWGGKTAHLVDHNWSYVLGWFTPRHMEAPAPPPPVEAPINQPDPTPPPAEPVEPPPPPYVPPAAPVPFPYDTTPYTVVKSIFGFDTATDAGNQTNAKQSVEAGDYFVYKRYPTNDTLINVTKTLGTAGTWINAAYNVPDPIPEPPAPELPVEPPKPDWPAMPDKPVDGPIVVPVSVVSQNFRSSYKAFPKPVKYVIQRSVLISEIGTQGKDVMLMKGGRDHPNYMLIYGTFVKDNTFYGRPKLATDTEFVMWYGVPLLADGRSPGYIEEDIIELEDIPSYAIDTVKKAQVELHTITDFLPFAVGKLTHYLTFVQQLLIGKHK